MSNQKKKISLKDVQTDQLLDWKIQFEECGSETWGKKMVEGCPFNFYQIQRELQSRGLLEAPYAYS